MQSTRELESGSSTVNNAAVIHDVADDIVYDAALKKCRMLTAENDRLLQENKRLSGDNDTLMTEIERLRGEDIVTTFQDKEETFEGKVKRMVELAKEIHAKGEEIVSLGRINKKNDGRVIQHSSNPFASRVAKPTPSRHASSARSKRSAHDVATSHDALYSDGLIMPEDITRTPATKNESLRLSPTARNAGPLKVARLSDEKVVTRVIELSSDHSRNGSPIAETGLKVPLAHGGSDDVLMGPSSAQGGHDEEHRSDQLPNQDVQLISDDDDDDRIEITGSYIDHGTVITLTRGEMHPDVVEKVIAFIKKHDEEKPEWRSRLYSDECARLRMTTKTSYKWAEEGTYAACQTCTNIRELCLRWKPDAHSTLEVVALTAVLREDAEPAEKAFWLRETTSTRTASSLWRDL